MLSQVNVGSDHRILKCRIESNTKYGRTKKLRKSSKSNYNQLNVNKERSHTLLKNKFKALEANQEVLDINQHNAKIIAATKQSSLEIAGRATKEKDSNLPSEIIDLLAK